ncbi:pyridoxamine 5'-phosphate oxidase [Crocinitomicaceae bacterium CZZ-1]|uniref:Pyridoxine/pyridoxamine 5'-phosphate oxidase n=1 Tax=Taishania pollutisoli TaxID=2766479 RepID=A0A8J6P5V7_9FLAO|nr:pyridoxamine 5'-phosphate oxidase [Taishania pollutisoli]MBC9812469.1 pyridoxamine 5'-phosphate oxidase [Taishania pollutisoli]
MEDFLEDLRNDHRDFDLARLEDVVGTNPFDLFNQWMKNAVDKGVAEANACVVSTVDTTGQPSGRIVYLKELINGEFIFYTNYHSHKGKDLAGNNKISMLFFWPALQQQIRIDGLCYKVPEQVSDAYFRSRPRGSKIGAWASNQSEQLISRTELEQRVHEYAEKFPGEVPRPPHWGGYAVRAELVEFWQGRPSRLHDRFVFKKEGENWNVGRLNP